MQSWFAPGQPKTREQLRNEVMERREEIGRSVAERFVRGNVNIKAGRFLTKNDLDARRERSKVI
jgi:sialic acid synthase SpsE